MGSLLPIKSVPTPREARVCGRKRHVLQNQKRPEEVSSHGQISAYCEYTYSERLRRGEGFGLTWNNINFQNKTLTVERNRGNYGTGTPKTKNSYRTIKIDDTLIDQLRIYKKWSKEKLLANRLILTEESFIFIDESGTPSSYENFDIY